MWENYKYKKNLSSGMLERKLKDKFHITLRIEKLNLGSRNEYDIFNEMFRLFERTLLEISCLTDNNLMLIDCLHSQYIFTDDPFIELSRTKSHQ